MNDTFSFVNWYVVSGVILLALLTSYFVWNNYIQTCKK